MEREEEELKIWISGEALLFLSAQGLKGVGGGLFIVLTSKRAAGESFHRTSLVGHQTSPVKHSRSQSMPNLFGPPDKSGGKPMEAGPDRTCPIDRTIPIPPPDKSGGDLWNPV
jgi:hypothetical protein